MPQLPSNLTHLTQSLLAAAQEAGADAADATAIHGTALSIDIRRAQIEQAQHSEGTEIGLRVFIGQRQACVSASDISSQTISELATRAVAMAREAPEDPYIGLADPDQLAQNWDLAALELHDDSPAPSPAALEDQARALEAAAGQPGISQSEASASHGSHHVYCASSNGFSGGYSRSYHSLSAMAISGEGAHMDRDYAAESRTFSTDLPMPDSIGQLAAERALARQGAIQPKTGRFPILFDERIAASLIGHMLSAINGAAIARGASWLSNALNTQILPPDLALIEDPTRPRMPASRPFDGEGLPCAPRHIIQHGQLMGWTLDLATGRQLGMPSTANAARHISSPPSPGVTNITLTPGSQSRADLIHQMGEGLLVTSLIGATINPVTGDYSRGASGFWVKGGVISHPVHECTIAGNLREMLASIIPANDAKPHRSARVPSLLIAEMALAGA